MAPLSAWASLAFCKDRYMRPEGSLQLTASSWQCWLHPESHRTRGFNTEPRCFSPEGIIGPVLREMDPQHSFSQGYPASTQLQCTQCTHTYMQTEKPGISQSLSLYSHGSLANLADVHSPVTSHWYTQTAQGYSYASYTVHIPHPLSCWIMHSPFICSPSQFPNHCTQW